MKCRKIKEEASAKPVGERESKLRRETAGTALRSSALNV
jgi:hypothetical protein